MRISGLIASLLLLAACSSMSRDECLTADWETVGYEDGASGQPRQRIGDHRKACAGHGVTPDRAAYDRGYEDGIASFCSHNRGLQAARQGQRSASVCPRETAYSRGYAEGLDSYCTFDSGFDEGQAGREYRRVCPGHLEDDFLAGYRDGSYIFDLRSKRDDLARRLDRLTKDREKADKRIEEIVSTIGNNDDLTREERIELLDESERLRDRNEERAAERVELEFELDETEDELERLGYD